MYDGAIERKRKKERKKGLTNQNKLNQTKTNHAIPKTKQG